MTADESNRREGRRPDELDLSPMSVDDIPDNIVLSETDVVPLGAPSSAPGQAPLPPPRTVDDAKADSPKASDEPKPSPVAPPPSRPPSATTPPSAEPSGPAASPTLRPPSAPPTPAAPAPTGPKPAPFDAKPAPFDAKPATPAPAAPPAVSLPTPAPEPPRAWRNPAEPTSVQVADYLLAIRRRILWLVLIPLAVGLVAAAVLATAPPQFRSRATVTLPIAATANKAPTAAEVGQAASDFQQVLLSDPVLDVVSKETGVSKSRIRDNLSTRRLGSSSLMNVTYEHRARGKATEVVELASRTGVQRLFEPAVVAANIAVETAERELNSTQAQIANFATRHSLATTPQEAYRSKQQQLALAQGQLGSTSGQARADLEQRIKTLQEEAAALASLAAEYQRLQAKVSPLTAVANAAAEREGDAKARLEASKAPSTVDIVSTTRMPRLRPIATGTATAVGAALLLVLALIVILELFDPARRAVAPLPNRPAAPMPQASQPPTRQNRKQPRGRRKKSR